MLEVDVIGAGLPAPLVTEACVLAAASAGIEDGHVAVEFVDEDRIAELNEAHRDEPGPTDVLSFPIDGKDELPASVPRALGDVVLCPQVVGDRWCEPLVHGLLHLLGYDHGDEMEAREEALRR